MSWNFLKNPDLEKADFIWSLYGGSFTVLTLVKGLFLWKTAEAIGFLVCQVLTQDL